LTFDSEYSTLEETAERNIGRSTMNNNVTMTVDSDGTKRWKNKEGQLHRTDGPAVEWV